MGELALVPGLVCSAGFRLFCCETAADAAQDDSRAWDRNGTGLGRVFGRFGHIVYTVLIWDSEFVW
jgi:hypothetical protein